MSEWVNACVSEWVSESVSQSVSQSVMPREQFVRYMIASTCYISMKWWWWCRLFIISILQWQSVGRHCAPLLTHYPASEPTRYCAYSLVMHAQWKSSKYQFKSLVWPARVSNPFFFSALSFTNNRIVRILR